METFLCLLATGLAGAYAAKKRKLNPFFWFVICSVLGLVGLTSFILIHFLLPFSLKTWKKWKKKKIPLKKETLPPPFSLTTIWYYLDEEDKQVGPMSLVRLLEIKQEGIIKETHYIWNESFNQWKLWESVFSPTQYEK